MDPTLESCCQKDREQNERKVATESILRLHDRIAQLERSHRISTITNFELSSPYCMEVGNGEIGNGLEDYHTLSEMRRNQMIESSSEGEDEENSLVTGCAVAGKSLAGDETDEDDDSEFDYLLECPELNLYNMEEEKKLELQLRSLHLKCGEEQGYGVHRHMNPWCIWKYVGIDSSHPPQAAVVHLYDPHSVLCAKLDILLEGPKFSTRYKGTRFSYVDGKMAIMSHLNIVPENHLPCLIAIREGKVVTHCAKLRSIVNYSNIIDEWALEEWLDRANVLIHHLPPIEDLCRVRPEEEALYASMMKKSDSVEEKLDSVEEFYDCGIDGCSKVYPHKHIGVNCNTESQDGYIISEDLLVSEEVKESMNF